MGTLFVTLVFIGAIVNTGFHDQSNDPIHISNLENPPQGYMGQILQNQGSTKKSSKYLIKISHIFHDGNCAGANGKVILYSDLDSNLSVGQLVMVLGSPLEISPPGSPYEFNYKEYLNNKGITHNHFVNGTDIHKVGSRSLNYYIEISASLRSKAINILDEAIGNPRERAVLNAVLIGSKTQLDKDTKNIYSDAGVMHILAVSGLHVGIIYFILLQVIKKIPLLSSRKAIQLILVILLLWIFAGISGFSSSVVRSVIMFSLFGFGEAINRHSSSFNTLATAAFLMIFFSPLIVTDVGFQLSFLAVLGILYLQPKISGLWVFRNKVLDWIWSLSTVGIAAQIATFPLGLYYFGKFPNYFLVSNLIVIPIATVVVCFGVLILLLHFTGLIGWLEFILEKIIYLTNEILSVIGRLPYSTSYVSDLSIVEVLILFSLILLSIAFLRRRRFLYLALLINSIFGLIILDVLHLQNARKPRIVYYPLSINCLDFFANGQLASYSDAITLNQLDYRINPTRNIYGSEISDNLVMASIGNKSKLIIWRGKSILIQKENLKLKAPIEIDYLLNEANYTIDDIIISNNYLDLKNVYTEIL